MARSWRNGIRGNSFKSPRETSVSERYRDTQARKVESLHRLDAGAMTGAIGQAPVPRDERRIQCLGQGDVAGIIGGVVPTKRPDTRQKNTVRMAPDRQIG